MTEVIRVPPIPNRFANRRIDLSVIKGHLQRVLADKSSTYWQVLKKFIQAKLTKHEFDEFARVSLGPQHLYLHNTFILSIISNAHCANPPKMMHSANKPMAVPSAIAAKAKMIADKSKRQNVERAVTDSPSHVQRIRSSSGVIRLQSGTQNGKSALAGRLLEEELELLGAPQLLALRRKMVQVAESAAVPRVSNDAVRYMMTALHHHVKGVMSSFCPYVCTQPRYTADGSQVLITTADVVAALEVNPSILGEDLAINRERALLSLESRRSILTSVRNVD